jgi:hypothetical protein
MPKCSLNFEELLSHAHRDFEEQNKVLGHFVIIINYFIIVINAYYNFLPDCWLEVSIRKVLRSATSAQVVIGFPVSKSEC